MRKCVTKEQSRCNSKDFKNDSQHIVGKSRRETRIPFIYGAARKTTHGAACIARNAVGTCLYADYNGRAIFRAQMTELYCKQSTETPRTLEDSL